MIWILIFIITCPYIGFEGILSLITAFMPSKCYKDNLGRIKYECASKYDLLESKANYRIILFLLYFVWFIWLKSFFY